MRYRGRGRPTISFSLATIALLIFAAWITGLLSFEVNVLAFENPLTIGVFVIAGIGALLLYEW